MSVIAMRRHKDDAGISVKNIEDLDNAIRLIGQCDWEIDTENIHMNKEIARIKKQATERMDQVRATRSTLIAICQTYVTAQRDVVLQGKKTAQLTFGKLGFRRLPAKITIPAKNSDQMEQLCDLLDALKASDPSDKYGHVSVHTRRHLDMEDLKQLSDEALAELELKRKPAEDQFFVQPDLHKIAELATLGGE